MDQQCCLISLLFYLLDHPVLSSNRFLQTQKKSKILLPLLVDAVTFGINVCCRFLYFFDT
uniref:Uncharacterized protein n=1 Tax=Rhizophora mucronata TaxID=61149 RepID=A0A2P2Q3S0_RHIMU